MAKILTIDDDKLLCRMLTRTIEAMGHQAGCAHTLADGLKKAAQNSFDIVLLDVGMPDGDGLAMIPEFQTGPGAPEVIIITGLGNAAGAELAIRNGAWDYLEKTALPGNIKLPISRALQFRDEKNRSASKPVQLKRDAIIGKSPRLQACLDLVAQAASSEINVLISGETGTGKELFARTIHQNSGRSKKLFVVVDCASLPETLVESILFGHEKGSFTGAEAAQTGLVKLADGGTLFLDEIGELPLAQQKNFLRVLQERRFRPLGSNRETTSDFRLIAATNRDLDAMVDAGTFRQDLLYRLRTLSIALPPLREIRQDLRTLFLHYMLHFCKKYSIPGKGFSSDFFPLLESYNWPGNTRELMNTVERTLTAATTEQTLFPHHLPTAIKIALTTDSLQQNPVFQDTAAIPDKNAPLPTLKDFRDQAYRQYAHRIKALAGSDIQKACTFSGLSRSRLYAFLKDYAD